MWRTLRSLLCCDDGDDTVVLVDVPLGRPDAARLLRASTVTHGLGGDPRHAATWRAATDAVARAYPRRTVTAVFLRCADQDALQHACATVPLSTTMFLPKDAVQAIASASNPALLAVLDFLGIMEPAAPGQSAWSVWRTCASPSSAAASSASHPKTE